MTGDEMERTIQFILQQQAQFATQHAQTEIQMGKLTDAVITITGVLGKLADAQTTLTEKQTALSERQMALTEAQTALSEAQARTEERLNSFIVFVERYINERRNGKN